MKSTIQRKLVLDDKPTLVLATVDTARHQLPGHDEDDILSLIEEGFLLYAWDIALHPVSKSADRQARREIRIWPDCIAWYARTAGKGQYAEPEDRVLATLVGTSRCDVPSRASAGGTNGTTATSRVSAGGTNATAGGITSLGALTSTRIRLLFNCGSTHIINLIETKQLSILPGTSWGTGPNGAALVTIASLKQFLTTRRL